MLYIYSGDVPDLDSQLLQALSGQGQLKVIAPCASEIEISLDISNHFCHLGINATPLSGKAYTSHDKLKKEVLASQAVFLCGGNTYAFLAFAKKINLFSVLAELEKNNKIIAAESAGSIILSKTIATAGIPTSCPDDNDVNIQDLNAMGRIPFHISPHFDPVDEFCAADIVELQALATDSGQPVLLLEDGEGFIMKNQEIIQFFGREKYLNPERLESPHRKQYQPAL